MTQKSIIVQKPTVTLNLDASRLVKKSILIEFTENEIKLYFDDIENILFVSKLQRFL